MERLFTEISVFPVIGTAAGVAKVFMGVAQVVTAVFIAIPSALRYRSWIPLSFSWDHIKHGFGNVVVGTLEAIPIVQTVIYGIRWIRVNKIAKQQVRLGLVTGHEDKFLPYATLVEQDWRITGDYCKVKFFLEIMDKKIKDSTFNYYSTQKLKWARQALIQCS